MVQLCMVWADHMVTLLEVAYTAVDHLDRSLVESKDPLDCRFYQNGQSLQRVVLFQVATSNTMGMDTAYPPML